jgi:hypothetical protein
MNQSLEIHIDELVLHGFPPGERYQIAEAVQKELTRLFAEQGIPPSFDGRVRLPSLDAGHFQMGAPNTGTPTGGQIAQSVYNSFHQNNQPAK